jgi:hypothetical protein
VISAHLLECFLRTADLCLRHQLVYLALQCSIRLMYSLLTQRRPKVLTGPTTTPQWGLVLMNGSMPAPTTLSTGTA